MSKIENESGIFNARYGYFKGNKYLFTHRDPKTGEVYREIEEGAANPWVPYECVSWVRG